MKNPNPTVGLRKYTGLMMSIIVLVLLVVSLLSLNLFLSSAIRTGGSTISAASGQSSLINQISKDLFLVNSREDAGLVLFEADKIWGWYKESVEPVFADQNFQTGELPGS